MFPYDILFISLISAGITHFLNYCFGKPSFEEWSPYEIFSGYTFWLSKRRLKKVGLLSTYLKQYRESLSGADSKDKRINLDNDFKKVVYNAADPFFTWERAVGMCPVCTGFWITLITVIIFLVSGNFSLFEIVLYLVSIIVISHIFIRLLNKII